MNIPVLYHYCSIETLFCIVSNKTIRLSDLSHMNDSLEMIWGRDKIFRYLKEEINYNMEKSEANFYTTNNSGVYASCFSEKGDILSQWRAYADDGKGVSIGFNFLKLGIQKGYPINSSILSHSLKIEKIIYSEEEQNMKLKEIGTKKFILSDPDHNILELGKIANFFKNPSFSEEQEWRLVYRDLTYKLIMETKEMSPLGNVKFREKNGEITSYLDYSFHNEVIENPIEEIVLGPKCKIKEGDLYFFLARQGFDLKKISIKRSTSSYR